ncbi:MAG: SGNH/GDSL hydrolase family protein [Candidatus Aminicenantes bacterium]|nr:SGNH/GDSL hydrolase family protein [Candidatus Aminicenantes bacterium]
MKPFMRLSPVCVLLMLSTLVSGEGNREPFVPGHSPFPAFSGSGELIVVFRDSGDRLGLAGFRGTRPEFTTRALSGRLLTEAPVLRKDCSGGLWAAWAEEGLSGNEIRLAKVQSRRIETVRKIRIGTDFPVSLDLAFDRENQPWLAFVLYSGAGYSVNVLPPRGGRPKTIASTQTEVSCVRLAAGPSRLNVFWTQDQNRRHELLTVSFLGNGAAAGAPESVVPSSSSPRLFLQAAIDRNGLPWLVWSGFDGNDYEIWVARGAGTGWGTESPITANEDQDIFPSLAILPDGSPLVVWQRSAPGSVKILARRRSADAWSREMILATPASPLSRPVRATADAGRKGLVWEEGGSVRTAIIESAVLAGLPAPGRPAASSTKFLKDAAVEDTYIGFGDSITYGVIDNQYAPERGYIPRLEALLRTRFGAASIVNEGWPGEITVNGMARLGLVLTAHPARYFLLMEGTNDVIFSEISMSATSFHLERMTAKALGAGAYPVLATIIPRNDWRWNKTFFRNRILSINTMIRALAQNLNLPLVEQFYAFYNYPEAEGGWQSLLSDKVHPTDKGYEIMTQTWYDEIIDLPFGPASPAVERTTQRSLFLSRPVNNLSWAHNLKVLNPTVLIGYNIFRKEDSSLEEEFTFLTRYFITRDVQRLNYADATIDPARRYRYCLQAVNREGVEGPLSEVIRD